MKAGNKNSCAMLWVQVSKRVVVKVDPKPSIKAYRIAYVAINQFHCCLIQQMSIHDLDNCKQNTAAFPVPSVQGQDFVSILFIYFILLALKLLPTTHTQKKQR